MSGMNEANEPENARPKVLEVLVENHRNFRAFLEQRVGNSADADEILQAAFVKSIEKGDTLRDAESAVAWFYRLLRNALVDFYRHGDAERRALEQNAAREPELEVAVPDLQQAVCQCVNDLLPSVRPEYAAMLRRIDLEGESISEIASEQGITANNARVRLHRARSALRRQLELSCGTCTTHGCLDCTCSTTKEPASALEV